jgi:hypothetical protein
MIPVPIEIRLQHHQSVSGEVWEALSPEGHEQTRQGLVRLALSQGVPSPARPRSRSEGAPVQPGCRSLPQALHGVVKVP